jgi:hypothetical protein
MRWAVSLAVIGALSLVACGSKGSKQLEGVWRGIGTDGVPSERQDTANQFAKTMQLEFRGDSLTVIANGTKSASPFRVVKEDKTVVQIIPGTDLEGQPETFNLIDDSTMRWQVLGSSTITFRKQ